MTEPVDATFDRSVLDRLVDSVGGDIEFVADLVETYLSDTRSQLAAIEAAIAAGDATSLVRPAHTLKSGSITVGAMRLGDLGRRLEQRGRAGDLAGVDGDVAAARDEWHRAQAALAGWVDAAGSAA